MSRRLIIIGTCHKLQCGIEPFTPEQIETFRTYVLDICRSENIRQIAEEMTEDGLKDKIVTETIFASVADELDIPNPYIDIDHRRRSELHIDDYSLGMFAAAETGGFAEQKVIDLFTNELLHPVRERVWYANLLKLGVWPSLFICGADHVPAIYELCINLGQDVEIAANDYKP